MAIVTGTCDGCGKHRRDLEHTAVDANGEPDGGAICWLCRQAARRAAERVDEMVCSDEALKELIRRWTIMSGAALEVREAVGAATLATALPLLEELLAARKEIERLTRIKNAAEDTVMQQREEIERTLTALREQAQRIAALEAENAALQKCPHDGTPRETAIDFCPKCGEEFSGPEGTEIKFRVQAAERARIIARLREEATKRLGEANAEPDELRGTCLNVAALEFTRMADLLDEDTDLAIAALLAENSVLTLRHEAMQMDASARIAQVAALEAEVAALQAECDVTEKDQND